jgi:hypothetical protein
MQEGDIAVGRYDVGSNGAGPARRLAQWQKVGKDWHGKEDLDEP